MDNIIGVRPVVSFCIPVYNNAEAALKIVNGILVSDSRSFEVVVSDDASTDEACELLSQIHDPRFRYIRNAHNLGAHKNWLQSLELGCGDWLYFVIGRDRIHGENINMLLELLDYADKNGITLLMDGYTKEQKPLVLSGIEAMSQFLDFYHPTASIFSRKHFAAITDTDKEYYFTHSDMYPENYIKRDLLLKGRGALIRSGVYIYPSPLIDKTKTKSTVENSINLYDMFYAPRRRTAQTYELIDMMDGLAQETFTTKELDEYFALKFYSLLLCVSLNWLSMCADHEWQAHYGQSVRHIGIREMMSNVITAYHDMKNHLTKQGTLTSTRLRIMRCKAAKALVYFPIRHTIKRILKTLGLLDKLREARDFVRRLSKKSNAIVR